MSLWDGESLDLLGTVVVPAESDPVAVSPVFGADGHVMLASYDGRVYRWDTDFDHALELACQMAGRNLTPSEWQAGFRTSRTSRPVHRARVSPSASNPSARQRRPMTRPNRTALRLRRGNHRLVTHVKRSSRPATSVVMRRVRDVTCRKRSTGPGRVKSVAWCTRCDPSSLWFRR